MAEKKNDKKKDEAPAQAKGSALSGRQKNIAILALAVVTITLGAYLFYPVFFPRPVFDLGKPSSSDAFFNKILNSTDAVLVFDISGTPAKSDYRDRLLQCGVGLAGSSGLAHLNKTIFALEGDACTTVSGNTSRDACIRDSQGEPLFILQAGVADLTQFYDNAMVITISPTYNSSCSISYLNDTGSVNSTNSTR